MYFSVPFNGDDRFLDELNKSKFFPYIKEIYFAGDPLIIPSGRRPKIRSFIKRMGTAYYFDRNYYNSYLTNLILDCKKNGIDMNLLLNFNGRLNKSAIQYVSKLIELGVSVLTVGSYDQLLQITRELKWNVKIQNSVYLSCQDIIEIKNLIKLGITVLLLPPDFNHDLIIIDEIYNFLKRKKIDLKIMLNEGCLKFCSHRKHDQIEAQYYKIEYVIKDIINNSESSRVLNQPCRRYLNKYGIVNTNFIHPKNIGYYLKFNPIFKIVGRSFCTKNILQTLNAYLSRSYNGDLRNIIENFKHSKEPVFYADTAKTKFLLNEG